MSPAQPTLDQIIQKLELKLITHPRNFAGVVPTSGYTSDLLSCVMASNVHQGIWITLQAHTNIVAVAALLDMCAVIITEGAMPDPVTVNKANEEGVILLSTNQPSFEVVGQLWDLGLRAR
jgi:hypothetical protein